MSAPANLRLDAVPLSRWRDFHAGRFAPSAVASDPLLSRWRRVADLGAAAEGASHPEGVGDHDLGDRRARLAALRGDGDALAAEASADLARRRVVMVLADDDGVIVQAHAPSYESRAVESRLVPGARWHERARGTNAIGTAIAERRSVAVIGGAHYERANHALFCYATPIVDPYGDVVGVFDVTGDVAEDDRAIAPAVRWVGASLESALRASAYAAAIAGGARVVERMLDRCAGPALLLEAPGLVRRANLRAARALGVDPQAGLTVERLFGVGWSDLAAEALSGSAEPVFETRSARYRLVLDPILGSRGRVLSIVAYLDPLPGASARRPSSPAPSARVAVHPALDGVIGDDPKIEAAKRLASRFAPTTVPVLLLAETGTGKELFARAIHAASPRASGPFVAMNCGAVSPQLLESELFGFAPGSFTGARQGGGEGKIAAAEGGTLFLDEIGEMTPALQATLLRVLEDGSYSRVGEATARKASFRLVCATCRDLPAMVASGAFRSDLFYRIHGACIGLPPLRERSDRVALAEALLADLARAQGMPAPELGPTALAHVEDHDWPGNVRELKSALAHALCLADGAIERDHFPELLVARSRPAPVVRSVRESEAEAVAAAVRAARGNLSEAARTLGVSRSTLYRMMARAGIDPSGA
ncbi:MAG: sigma-54-dependent Fis family transcriptional regulator [Myxococcales bacterium]|nr:sigma-54-dependent Fis family transcriptional regulator [Myxococcales bacterium]